MLELNKVLMTGRLTRDPEMKYTQSGMSIAKFSIACNRRRKNASGDWEKEASFFDCTAWGKTAEFVQQYFVKGKAIFVEGELRQERWTNKEGQPESKVAINVNNVSFVESLASEQASGGGGGPSPGPRESENAYEPAGGGAARDDSPAAGESSRTKDDLPF